MKASLKIVKIGGQLLQEESRLSTFLKDFVQLPGPKVLVHGGGVQATELASRLKIPVKMYHGRRLTDKQTIDIISMAYAGLNKHLVGKLLGLDCSAIGLSGVDVACLIAEKRPVKEVDYGYVGDIIQVNTGFIDSLLKQGITPVFSALSSTSQGHLLNTNADSVATELALALALEYEPELYFCFEKNGVLKKVSDPSSVISEINPASYLKLKQDGIISAGMLPKLDNCFRALKNGVRHIYLGSERMLGDNHKSTKITSS